MAETDVAGIDVAGALRRVGVVARGVAALPLVVVASVALSVYPRLAEAREARREGRRGRPARGIPA